MTPGPHRWNRGLGSGFRRPAHGFAFLLVWTLLPPATARAAEPARAATASCSSILSVVFAPGAVAATGNGARSAAPEALLRNPALGLALEQLGARTLAPAFPASAGADEAARGLSRFYHLEFGSPEAALAAAARLAALPGVLLAQTIPDQLEVSGADRAPFPAAGPIGHPRTSPFPDDPYFQDSALYGADAQWPLLNTGAHPGTSLCGPALAGADLRIVPVWRKYFRGGGAPADSEGPLGSPGVVLGFVDMGLLSTHPDLHVLAQFSHDPRFTFCPDSDWCGDHGTKMAGLAAMATDNGIGAAGVCGDCALLDLRAPACDCAGCGNLTQPCLFVHSLWYTRLAAALPVDLGSAPDGQPRRLKVVNASFASNAWAPLEEVQVLWDAFRSGVLTVAGSGDHSLPLPVPQQPANIPFVLGVGGSTWEDRFWDASASCYGGNSGTTVGPGVVRVTAPASGSMLTALPADNPGGGGPYAWTSGQCSGAAALVTGTAGLLQSYAHDQSPLHRDLEPDDLAGLLTSTTRPFRSDPTVNATCPADTCPLADYGSGIVSAENAFYVLAHADLWQEFSAGFAQGATVEFVPPEFIDAQGTEWRRYRITWEFTLPPRPPDPDAPADLPTYIAWPLRARSTTLISYGNTWQQALYAQAGITDCAVELDRANGKGRLVGFNFAQVKDGIETPLVPWDALRAGMKVWSQVPPGEPWPGAGLPSAGGTSRYPAVELAGPNPFLGDTWFRIRTRPGAEATVKVVDLLGRIVRDIYTGTSLTGEITLTWDGKNSQGRAAPAGLYWIRAWSQGETAARPVARMR